jgi:Tol biopolymer transport system component
MQLTWFDRGGKPLGTVGAPGEISAPSISPDGSTVAVDAVYPQASNFDIWLHNLARGTASRFTFGPNLTYGPVWSSDGTQIVFASNRDGAIKLYLKATGGAGKEELLLKSPGLGPSDWSRDGRFVIYSQNDSHAKVGIWVLPLSGHSPPVPGKPFPFLQTEFNEWGAKLSRDGKWVAYTSDETGRNEVYVQTFPTPGDKSQISTSGGSQPIWNRDGRELFYLAGDSKLMAVEVKTGSRLEAGAPKPLFDTHLGATGGFDISPDGRRFLLANSLGEADRTPITVIVNWNGELRR